MAANLTDVGTGTWMAEGLCRTHDPELFFPISAGDASADQVREATSVCRRCDVANECLDYALSNGIKHGIWGGRTEQERIASLRNRRANRSGLRGDAY